MSKRFKDKGRIDGIFVPVLLERGTSAWYSASWKVASPHSRLLYIALKARYILPKNGNPGNNGRIHLSIRDAAKELGFSRTQVAEYFRELVHYGFIVLTNPGCLGVDGHGKSPHYRLTELGYMHEPPTRDYLRWDGALFERRKRPSRLHTLTEKNRIPSARSGQPGTTLRTPLSARSGQLDG